MYIYIYIYILPPAAYCVIVLGVYYFQVQLDCTFYFILSSEINAYQKEIKLKLVTSEMICD